MNWWTRTNCSPIRPEFEQHLDALYGSTFRIGAYTVGYTRELGIFRHIATGIGANFTAYTLPRSHPALLRRAPVRRRRVSSFPADTRD